MNKVLVITFSNLKTDNRVKRQLSFLKSMNFSITVASNDGFCPEGMQAIQLKTLRLKLLPKLILSGLLLLRFYSLAYQFLYGQSFRLNETFDLVVANDIEALPLAFALKGNAKIIFDAHEYAPRHFEDRLSWRIFFQGFNKFLCKKFIPKVDGMITVGQRIADEYLKHYGVKPILITNAPDYANVAPTKTNPEKIRLVHQGSANPSRKLEIMIEMIELLDEKFHLDLMLMKPPPTHRLNYAYYQHLERILSGNERVRLVPPISSENLIEGLRQYDIGVIILPPINFNYANTLPNKFFECIQARVALAIGPTPEIAAITQEYDIGVVSKDFTAQSLAEELRKINVNQIDLFKINTEKVAKEFNAGNNLKRFTELIKKVMAD
ncbi:MAG: hypothetical protein QM734_07630 [Cyclobacteriaceae bacterium]